MTSSADATIEMIDSSHGVRLALHHFGGSGPTLLICHATGMNATAYLPMATQLGGFDVWAIDLRAHGDSTPPANDEFEWINMADDVLAAVDHVGTETVKAVGHSMGGTSLLLAEKKRPGTITDLFLYEPIVFPGVIGPRNNMMAEAARSRRSSFASKQAALFRYASRPPLNRFRSDALFAYVDGGFVETDDGTVELACRPEHEAATFMHAGTPATELTGVMSRARIAAGQPDSNPSPADFARETAEALPNADFVEYQHLGHFGPLQDPDTVGRDAAVFLR